MDAEPDDDIDVAAIVAELEQLPLDERAEAFARIHDQLGAVLEGQAARDDG